MADRPLSTLSQSSSIFKSVAGRTALLHWYDAQLEQFPVPIESTFVTTAIGHTHVLITGPTDAPPVIVLHGMNMNALAMDTALIALSTHYRVYAIDIVGMPGKSVERRLPRAGLAYPHWLTSVMDQLGLLSARWIGMSFGGWLLLKLGTLTPERITHGVLLDAGGLVPFTARGQLVAGMTALRYMRRPTLANLLRAAQPFYAPGLQPDPAFMELLGLGYQHVTLDVDLKGLPPLSVGELARLHAPFLVIYGAHDIFFNVLKAAAQAQDVIPHVVETHIIPDQGHVMSRSASLALYKAIDNFLGRSYNKVEH